MVLRARFGNADQAQSVFMSNEIAPLQTLFETFNEWAGDELVRFQPIVSSPS